MDDFSKIDFLNRMVQEMIDAFSKLNHLRMGSGGIGTKARRWQKACEAEVEINVDESSSWRLMQAEIGCVLRDDQGKWRGGEGRNMGFVGALTAELLVIRCGLMFALKRGHKRMVLEFDSIEVIDCLLGGCKGSK